jgi:hypothetical protein
VTIITNHTSVESFIQYYHENFIPAYGDVTSYLLEKPESVLLGLENISSHLIQFLDSSKETSIKNQNLEKAFHHLERATLDCYKILWIRMQTDLTEICTDQEMRKFCVNIPEGQFIIRYEEFMSLIREARKYELNNVGNPDISITVDYYKRAIETGVTLCGVIDHLKIQDYKKTKEKWLKKFTTRDIVVGIIGAVLGAILWELIRLTGVVPSVLHYLHP